jgi:hypothetical protein
MRLSSLTQSNWFSECLPRVNLERTQIRSPVNGWVTNLLAQRDDFTNIGQSEVSLVDSALEGGLCESCRSRCAGADIGRSIPNYNRRSLIIVVG